VGIHVVVRRELRLDVRQRDVAPRTDDESLEGLREVELAIDHREVVAVDRVVLQQLVARQAIRSRVTVVLTVERRQPHAPVDVILLHGIGKAIEIDHELIELHRVGGVDVRDGSIAARPDRVAADVEAGVDPAVDLEVVIRQPFAEGRIGHRRHQRAVDRTGSGYPERGHATMRPLGERHRRRSLRGRRPALAAGRQSVRVDRRPLMAPFELVVIVEALEKAVAEIGIETGVVLVGIDRSRATHRRGPGTLCELLLLRLEDRITEAWCRRAVADPRRHRWARLRWAHSIAHPLGDRRVLRHGERRANRQRKHQTSHLKILPSLISAPARHPPIWRRPIDVSFV
jgi:hypothetical protein